MKKTTTRRWVQLLAPLLLAGCATTRLPSTPGETAPPQLADAAAEQIRQVLFSDSSPW